jgi:copper chaperone CopZ
MNSRRILNEMEPLNPKHLDPADPHNLQETDQPVLEEIVIATEGEDCDECVRKLREPLTRIDGVKHVRVDTKRERVIVTFDARKTHPPDLHDAILKSGYKPAPIAD